MPHIVKNITADPIRLINLDLYGSSAQNTKYTILANEEINLSSFRNPSGKIFADLQLRDAIYKGNIVFVVLATPLTQAESIAYFTEYTFASSGGGDTIPSVADEEARDSTYPDPEDLFQVYNQRTNNLETYHLAFELWLSSDLIVMIRPSVLIVANRLVYPIGSITVSGFDYATVAYPSTNGARKQTIGAVVQIGKDIDGTNAFVAVAHSNKYYIDFAETISVTEYLRAKTSGSESDIGKISGATNASPGVIGVAVQNSGATVGKPNQVLTLLNLASEIR